MKAKDKAFIEELGGSADEALLSRYAYRVSDYLKSKLADRSSNDPLVKQYIPSASELEQSELERDDPIGDEAHSPVKGIVHRYPDRVLFTPVHVCPVYCRYCFRREMVGPKDGGGAAMLSQEELEGALAYIASRTDIYEVILTGGDPLVISSKQLDFILSRLQAIEHVQVVRIHSRVPAADPMRVDEKMLSVLSRFEKALYLAIHINHADELSMEVRGAIKQLRASGVILLSQSVLLKDVNDNEEALEALFRGLVALGVKPYYLHHPDMARGTGHFRVNIEDGQALMRGLQGRLSGLSLPRYMLDIPGGYGKVPLEPIYIRRKGDILYEVVDYKGGVHDYPPKK